MSILLRDRFFNISGDEVLISLETICRPQYGNLSFWNDVSLRYLMKIFFFENLETVPGLGSEWSGVLQSNQKQTSLVLVLLGAGVCTNVNRTLVLVLDVVVLDPSIEIFSLLDDNRSRVLT